MKDFFVILPSNACGDTHPTNEANKYIVSWETPIEVDTLKWKVALTEASFNYVVGTVNSSFGVEYSKTARIDYNFNCTLHISSRNHAARFEMFEPPFPTPVTRPTFDNWKPPTVYLSDKGTLVIEADNWFTVTFGSQLDAQKCGFEHTFLVPAVPTSSTYLHRMESAPLLLPQPPEEESEEKVDTDTIIKHIIFMYKSRPYSVTYSAHVTSEKYWEEASDMIDAVRKDFAQVFQEFEFKNERIEIKMQPGIHSVTFLNGLNIVLGFQKREYSITTSGEGLVAEYRPQLRRGINNLYIYASVCQAIQVGGVRAPLLKSVWLDVNKRDYKFAEVCNVVIKNPMYIPISSTSINSIEVNIRSDSGRLVPFVDGSITSLTLHFKQVDE